MTDRTQAHRISAPALALLRRDLNATRASLSIASGAVVLIGSIAIGILGALPSLAQTQLENTIPAFEAASVRLHQDSGERNRSRSIEPGRITGVDITLGQLIAGAYGLKSYQLSGPDWIVNTNSTQTYDVVATAGKPVPVEETMRMLQPLLAERFHLAIHRETRELPVFALLVAKGGPKFKEPGNGDQRGMRPDSDGGLSFTNYSMNDLADWLAGLPSMERPVIDRTGLAGRFSFHANLFGVAKGADPGELKRSMVGSDAADTLRAALPQQLGLKLEAQKTPLEILVIDHADKVPTAN